MSLSYKQNNKELYVVVTGLVSAACVLCDAAGEAQQGRKAAVRRLWCPAMRRHEASLWCHVGCWVGGTWGEKLLFTLMQTSVQCRGPWAALVCFPSSSSPPPLLPLPPPAASSCFFFSSTSASSFSAPPSSPHLLHLLLFAFSTSFLFSYSFPLHLVLLRFLFILFLAPFYFPLYFSSSCSLLLPILFLPHLLLLLFILLLLCHLPLCLRPGHVVQKLLWGLLQVLVVVRGSPAAVHQNLQQTDAEGQTLSQQEILQGFSEGSNSDESRWEKHRKHPTPSGCPHRVALRSRRFRSKLQDLIQTHVFCSRRRNLKHFLMLIFLLLTVFLFLIVHPLLVDSLSGVSRLKSSELRGASPCNEMKLQPWFNNSTACCFTLSIIVFQFNDCCFTFYISIKPLKAGQTCRCCIPESFIWALIPLGLRSALWKVRYFYFGELEQSWSESFCPLWEGGRTPAATKDIFHSIVASSFIGSDIGRTARIQGRKAQVLRYYTDIRGINQRHRSGSQTFI